MNPIYDNVARGLTRRTFLSRGAYGLGGMALACLLNPLASVSAATANEKWRGVVNPAHFPPRARRVIHLCMAGGPSHLESFDNKAALRKIDGEPFPESFTKGQQLAQLQGAQLKALAPFCDFKRWGKSGQEISTLFPFIGGLADDICIVRSMHTEQINHDPAHAFMNSGTSIKGRPSMGSWLLYGLGAESENLPGFIVLTSQGGGAGAQPVSARQWSSGFLPSEFQGILFQSKGDPVHYVGNPEGVCQSTQRQIIEEVNRLNGFLAQDHFDPEIQTRISQYELAFRMQSSVPELSDLKSEPASVLDQYGVKHPGDGSFASNCLLARRLAERGVRFIQLYHRAWDHHGDIAHQMPIAAKEVDQAGRLVQDLKQRGMLEDTLVIWGGEFGRTPMGQGSGRDHHINAFSIWMAGGGIKPGITWGQTDELGYKYVEDDQQMHVHDLHATMLYLCGIDHKRLTYRYQGRDFRLTDVSGEIAHGIVA